MKRPETIDEIEDYMSDKAQELWERFKSKDPELAKNYNKLEIYNLYSDFCDELCCANFLALREEYLSSFIEWLQE